MSDNVVSLGEKICSRSDLETADEAMQKKYADNAAWANQNDAKIEERDDGFYLVAIPAPSDAVRAAHARRKRDALLAATDFYLAADYPADSETLEAVKTYRQALRDVPAQEGFPQTIEWPTKPEM